MLRRGLLVVNRLRNVRLQRLLRHRPLCSSPAPSASSLASSAPSTSSSSSLPVAAPPPHHHLAPHHGGPRRLAPLLALSTLSLVTAAGTVYLYADDLEGTLERSRASAARVVERMQQTCAAGKVLCKSLMSVLSSANHEVRSGFELRVAALLADIAAASAARRAAIVSAGGGAVIDWLLESVVRRTTQAEAARALAHLLADPWVAPVVLGRPRAVPCLLQFIFSYQPKRGKKNSGYSSFNVSDHSKGRSMLVAALMDIITSNCDNADYSSFQPLLPSDADTRDIAAAIEVIEQGGMHFDFHDDNNSDDGDSGLKGIGIKVLGGTAVLGFSREINSLEADNSDDGIVGASNSTILMQETVIDSPLVEKLSSAAVPGLWDDLQREHVAVPFATWALANWAIASDLNRSRIQELDSDGHAVTTALKAPERTVKWHGAMVARALLEDQNLNLAPSVPDWCSSLLLTASQAAENGDMSLAQMSLSTFLLSMIRCNESKFVIRQKGLHLLRSIAKKIENENAQSRMKESLAVALSLLYAGEVPLSLEETQRWSGILLRWLFDKSVSEITNVTAVKILSCILEDYGPASVPISQGWLALMLFEILGDNKTQNLKGTTQPQPERVKNQVDHHNASSATQILNQLATAVVKLATVQSDYDPASGDKVPLSDFFSLEPFATALKNLNKKSPPKFDAADSASATLKGIKALAELCSEDGACQKRIADLGVLSLLRRILLGDDYEKLAAIEAYDASRIREVQDKNVSTSNDSSNEATADPSSVRVPPAAHIRRHAGRLVTILSLLPNSKKAIFSDDVWCKWLEECASGRVPCNDLKLKSYCRLTLLNVFCSENPNTGSVSDEYSDSESEFKRKCPQFGDALFLLNPELPLEVHLDNKGHEISKKKCKDDCCIEEGGDSETGSSVNALGSASKCAPPSMDVVFIHGLRGGPFNSWRIADDKSSTTKAGLVESIDEDAGKEGTCWPREWLAADFPQARFLTVKYKTNLTQWTGASLPLQEVSSMLLRKLIAAGIGSRPVVFVTHSMGGLVVKQMLYQAKLNNYDNFLNNTNGLVFYSCPHFGSKLADMPWRMGLVFRPAPSVCPSQQTCR
ncbi:hypothetical protein E2562_008014 [Oryza meyeriana var. granulata]|uniref:GPI inositol-deacylase n=1 Tax=Oryza meyeriana var. granulata TaxID=110450 RepID=A0A6G1DGE2_9ORYZ|nr:hypothetical protein E2562_008014 [Oryza meyeriana var. granulata]